MCEDNMQKLRNPSVCFSIIFVDLNDKLRLYLRKSKNLEAWMLLSQR